MNQPQPDPWAELAAELHTTTAASPRVARQWCDLGQECGWSVATTRRWATEGIGLEISPADYMAILPWVQMDAARHRLITELRRPFIRILDWLIRIPWFHPRSGDW